MSLYVGHIPPHIQHEELERVFWKFGRCTLQMKDGYAFAVFEVSDDAEAALRTLRGKSICGEQLSLSWSKKQPRPFQKSTRLTKFYEPYRRRNFREEDHGVGKRVSRDRRDFSAGNSRIPAYNRGKHRNVVLNRGAGYVHENIDDIGEERGVAPKGRLTDAGNSSEPNQVAIDRWGEPVSDRIEMRNDDEFDRYEPYHGYDREDDKEGNQMVSSYGSPYQESPRGNGGKEHPVEADKNIDNSKPQRACYNCGLKGHVKHHCPERDPKREKFGKFSHRRGEINFRGRNDGKLKMPRTSSWGRLDGSRDPLISSRQERDRKESHSGNYRKLVRRSKNVSERSEKKCPNVGAESQAKTRSKQKHETRKEVLKKRSSRKFKSRSVSSSSSSQTCSRTSKSKSRTSSHSASRSISSRSRAVSCSSRSASVSPYHKSKSTRSRSRSRPSSHRSLSLSVSLDKKPPSSPLNLNVSEDRASPKDRLEQPMSPDSKHHSKDNMENFDVEDGNSPVTHKVNCETDGEHSGDIFSKARYSAPTSGYEESNSGINLPKDVAAVSENHRERSNGQETLPIKPNEQIAVGSEGRNETLPIKPNEQIAVGSEGRNPTRITTQEMIFALKHYGLPAPEESEPGLSVEGYFGAARLWPWEMIYYRRLKKGPISTENYARRLEQNKEFGIVDRYIRSSSGWGEQE